MITTFFKEILNLLPYAVFFAIFMLTLPITFEGKFIVEN